MDTTKLEVNLANAVLVFNDLLAAPFLRDRLTSLLPPPAPLVFEVSTVMVINYRQHGVEVFILRDQNRLEVKTGIADEESLRKLASTAHGAWEATEQAALKAYGFNVFAHLRTDVEDSGQYLLEQFPEPMQRIEQQLGVQLTTLAPRLTYLNNGTNYQLTLSPLREDRAVLDLQFNAQFDQAGLPEVERFTEQSRQTGREFYRAIARLFEA